MKKYLIGLFLLILSTSLTSFLRAEQADFSREEKIKKANELYISGKIYLRDGDYTKANEAFKQAQELLSAQAPVVPAEGGLAVYMHSLAVAPAEVKKTNKAIKVAPAKPQRRKFKKADDFYNQGIECIQLKEYNQAEYYLKEAIRFNPKDKNAYYNLGVLYENYFVDKNNALACYQRYVQLEKQADNVDEVKTWIKDLKKEMSQND